MTHVLALFNRQVELRPEHSAVRFGQQSLTYAELAGRVDAMAARLRTHGVGRDFPVGIHLERSPELVTCVLAVLRAGGACVPLDMSYPASRLDHMMKSCGSRFVVAAESAGFLVGRHDIETLDPSRVEHESSGSPFEIEEVDEDALAYILYTSGSTGVPKGVGLDRHTLTSLIEWQVSEDGDTPPLTTAQFAPISFDVSFQEILSTLSTGGTLVLVPEDVRRDPGLLLRFIADERIERLFLPTAALHQLAVRARLGTAPESLRHVYVAGEQLRITPAIRDWFRAMPQCRLHNHYGPTESHVVTSWTMDEDVSTWPSLPPIGRPLPHAVIHVLDQAGAPVAPGEIGEVYLEGSCLARGYIGLPELTAERFTTSVAGRRLYRTGDLGREQDGLFEYRGRIDQQVKVRGYRVELGEIESVVTELPDVAECVVTADDDASGNQRLVAYVVPRMPASTSTPATSTPDNRGVTRVFRADWRDRLARRLPDFMLPAAWVTLAELPMTPSGKIDRHALPPVPDERPPLPTPFTPPRSSTEKRIAATWCDALRLSAIGIDDNFFDLGGSSLLAGHVVSRLREDLAEEVPLLALYQNPTVRAMARHIGTGPSQTTPLPGGSPQWPTRRSSTDPTVAEPIAVIGMACRFPGAPDPHAFWRNLCDGVESITFFGDDSTPDDNGFVAAAGVLADVDFFDAQFFGVSAHEARLLDPQHRIFLECAWEALEDAACEPRTFPGRIGVFGGVGPSTYLLNNSHPSTARRPDRNLLNSSEDVGLLLASDKDFLTARVSYKLDLRGPSLNLNAACATSLFAVHYACTSLAAGESDLALAGAACIPTPQLAGHYVEPSMPFSPDGHTRPFDAQAAGTVFGSGVGVVALKRLSDALNDGDDIYAIIRGSAVNNDGALKVGMTAPSAEGQFRVITDAMRAADVDPATISFVEAHGTATPVGDPIELAALTRAFRSEKAGWCALGSVKSNVGHLGWAAGMAGFIKAVLALRHKKLPPTLHFTHPNPDLELDHSPFFVNTTLIDLPGPAEPQRAGVSAFGLGGSNAHVVLEAAPPARPIPADEGTWHVVPLSARSASALAELATRYSDHLQRQANPHVADIARTASLGRRHDEVRRALVASDPATLQRRLHALADRPVDHPASRQAEPGLIVGLFTGHGGEYLRMGEQLYLSQPVFRSSLDSFDTELRHHIGKTASEALYTAAERAPVSDVVEAHALIFTVQTALVEFWKSIGIQFDAVLGHSLGEFAAACAAGVFGPAEGLALVVERGRLMRELPPVGTMAAVFAGEDDVRKILDAVSSRVDIAAVNSSANTVISGPQLEVARACQELETHDLQVKKLHALRAGHSSLMEPILDDFAAAVDKIDLRAPRLPLISNLTGSTVTDEVRRPKYWRRQLRETVRFADGLQTAQQLGARAFVEIGGTPILLGLGQEVLPDHPGPWLPTLHRKQDDTHTIATAVASLYDHGFDVDWSALVGERGRPVHLPTYPFQRKRFWIDPPDREAESGTALPQAERSHASWRDVLYQVEWRTATIHKGPSPRVDGEWLIFADRSGLGTALAAELETRGGRCVLVSAGDRYANHGGRHFVVDPTSPQDIEALFAELGESLHGVLHLWNVDTADAEPARAQDVVDLVQPSVGSTLHVVQSLLARHNRPRRLWLLSQGAQSISDHDAPAVASQAPTWGLARVLRVEQPSQPCWHLDLPATGDASPAAIVDVITSEPSDRELALREGVWHCPRLVRLTTVAPAPQLRSDATYLVTGGLGGLGLWSARSLVARGARALVLAGRSAPSPASAAKVEELRRLGAEVVVSQLDVTDRSQVDQLLDDIELSGRPLAGVLHCAGAIDDGLITELDWSRFAHVLAPKVQGAWNLHTATSARAINLDFFVLFSSATAVLGNFGQANYAAANAYLDALAHHRRAKGLPGLAINWGVWSGVGALAERSDLLAQLGQRGLGCLSPAVGAAALEHHLASPAAQVAALPNEWAVFLSKHNVCDVPFFAAVSDGEEVRGPAKGVALRLAEANFDERPALLMAHVLDLLSTALGCDPNELSEDDSLIEMGMDSLTAVQIRNTLQRDLSCTLPAKLIFTHPTVRRLADHVALTCLGPEWATEVIAANSHEEARTPEQSPGTSSAPPLTFQQRRWLSLTRDVNYGQRVVPVLFHTSLQRHTFSAALRVVVGRHELLRYRYPAGGVEVVPLDDALPADEDLFHDLTALSPDQRAAVVARHVRDCWARMPDPHERPSWTVRCLELSDQRFALLVGAQHLEFDGSGLSVFVSELRHAYAALTEGGTPSLPVVAQYREYAEQQQSYLSDGLSQDRSFFEGLFTSVSTTTRLTGHPGFARTQAFESRRFTAEEPLAPWPTVLQGASGLEVSPFAVLLASYARLVANIAGTSDAVVGMIRSSRNETRFATTIGPFTAPFPIPIAVDGRGSVDLTAQCHRLVDAIISRGQYPPVDLIDTTPAFAGFPIDTYFTDACVNFLNYRKQEQDAGHPRVEVLEVLGPVAHPDFRDSDFGALRRIPGLHLVADVSEGALRANYWYHTHRFTQMDIAGFATEHRVIMTQLLNDLLADVDGTRENPL